MEGHRSPRRKRLPVTCQSREVSWSAPAPPPSRRVKAPLRRDDGWRFRMEPRTTRTACLPEETSAPGEENHRCQNQFGRDDIYQDNGRVATINNSTDSGNDANRTFNETKVRAERGDAKAQFDLGCAYFKGDGVAKDEVEAMKWWRKAAEQGHAGAQYNLAYGYAIGSGVTKDVVESFKWCHKAAEQGNVIAQYILGLDYRAGTGTSRNYEEAAKWHQKAAEQGLADAQIELGKLYSSGLGVPQNYQKAAEMFRMAAEQGNGAAQGVLGYCYLIGQGVPNRVLKKPCI